jgi:ribonuclease R
MEAEANRDYPASISKHSPWYEKYPVVEDYFARLAAVTIPGDEIRDLLVIHPIESVWSVLVKDIPATDAEREIGRRMGCLLLQGRTGEYFGGVISGVMNFGFFVELDNMPVEGMVRVETLGRDYYVYDEERQELRGEHTGEAFRLGQRVTVKLAGVHVGRLEIDLEYQKDEEGRRPFRRKDDDRAPRRPRPEGKFGNRRSDGDEREGGFKKPFGSRFRKDGDDRGNRRAFADRKGFRPRFDKQDDELARQRRYASESWGGEEEQQERRPFRDDRGFSRKPRFERDDRHENGERSFRKPFGKRFERDEEGRGEARPFRKEFRRDFQKDDREGGFKKPFGSRFHKDGEERPFRERGFKPRFEKKHGDDRLWNAESELNEQQEGREERSFRKDFQRDGDRPFRKPFGKRFDREEGRSFERRPFHGFDDREGGENEERPFRKPRFEREDGERSFRKPFGHRFERDGEERSEGRPFRKEFRKDDEREGGFKKPFKPRFHKDGEDRPFGHKRDFGKGRFDRDDRGEGRGFRSHNEQNNAENEAPVLRFGKRVK